MGALANSHGPHAQPLRPRMLARMLTTRHTHSTPTPNPRQTHAKPTQHRGTDFALVRCSRHRGPRTCTRANKRAERRVFGCPGVADFGGSTFWTTAERVNMAAFSTKIATDAHYLSAHQNQSERRAHNATPRHTGDSYDADTYTPRARKQSQ